MIEGKWSKPPKIEKPQADIEREAISGALMKITALIAVAAKDSGITYELEMSAARSSVQYCTFVQMEEDLRPLLATAQETVVAANRDLENAGIRARLKCEYAPTSRRVSKPGIVVSVE